MNMKVPFLDLPTQHIAIEDKFYCDEKNYSL